MEQLVYSRIIETLTRLETKIDEVNHRTERIEARLDSDETESTTQWYGGDVQ
jgi:hypothetical protein